MFAVNDNNRFVKDEGFDFFRVSLNWHTYKGVNTHIIIDGKVEDFDIDISDIPPTIFLACVVNTYAQGFSPCVGLDFSLDFFSKGAAAVFAQPVVDTFPEAPLRVLHYFWKIILECNRTSKINTKAWFDIGRQNGLIWNLGSGPDMDKDPITSIGSLQGIVETARKAVQQIQNLSN